MMDVLELFEEVVEPPKVPSVLEVDLLSDPREKFTKLLSLREEIKFPSALQAQEGLEAELLEMYRQRFPRRKPKLPVGEGVLRHPKRWEKIRALCEPFAAEREAIIVRHQAQNEEQWQTAKEQRAMMDKQLFELAPKVEVLPGTTWTEVASISPNDYRSQTQASWYAHGAAELRALAYIQGGFQTEIREVTTRWIRSNGQRPLEWKVYEVWVMIDEIDAKVLEYRGEDELKEREWLQACHDRSLNPRVYQPFLDWDVEDRLGMRQWGGHVAVGEAVPVRKQMKEERDDVHHQG